MIVSLITFISNIDSSSDVTISIISSISLFAIINAIVPDPWIFFWIAASVADAAAVNNNRIKTFLANGGSTFFINGKPAVINGLIDSRNPPLWLVIFLVVSFNKISLFLKDICTFIIYFIFILYAIVILELAIDEILFF